MQGGSTKYGNVILRVQPSAVRFHSQLGEAVPFPQAGHNFLGHWPALGNPAEKDSDITVSSTPTWPGDQRPRPRDLDLTQVASMILAVSKGQSCPEKTVSSNSLPVSSKIYGLRTLLCHRGCTENISGGQDVLSHGLAPKDTHSHGCQLGWGNAEQDPPPKAVATVTGTRDRGDNEAGAPAILLSERSQGTLGP